MPEIMTIPAPAYRAFKVLPLQKGQADASRRFAEFVRLGVTAYDYTMTFSDGFALLRCAWPKPKEMGNALEGYYAYLTKAEFQRLEYEPKKGAFFPLDERECPFQRDILSPSAVQFFFDLTGTAKKTGKIELSKKMNPCILSPVIKALATICKGGEVRGDTACTFDIGASSDMPLTIRAYVGREGMSLDAIVMPVRM